MKILKNFIVLVLTCLVVGCSSNKILFPTQLEYASSAQLVLDEFLTYIQSQGYTILNVNDTRMTIMGPSGFLLTEYIETEWRPTGFFDESTGQEYIVKQKVWIILDSGMITVESVVGYMYEGELYTRENAPPKLYNFVTALPEGLRNLVSSKSL
ncbi:MAG: hypothetical protein QF743_09045 [Candidatus Marinimicrobia bacterium]|jgi:hypothetical protein|nr:hypothetical protein [Candidatus Neomarinimicrobiota bacterium]MDP6611640.1 hypothetical protein [Candidatus Neomarinimicrobiota bacterium]|tara:strand:- start:24170 stop:24631 length:462 start_codon:yes stop_codon:yes gene_type:complete